MFPIKTYEDFQKRLMLNIAYMLRDLENKNILHDDTEFKNDDEALAAIMRAMGDIGSIPPFVNVGWGSFAYENTAFQMFSKLVAAHLLQAEYFRQFRNEVQTAETNTSRGILDKASIYIQASDRLKSESLQYFNAKLDKENILGGYGGARSTIYFGYYAFY